MDEELKRIVLTVDDQATIRGDVKWAAEGVIHEPVVIEAANKPEALRIIAELRDQIFAVVCDGDLGDGNNFGGLEVLEAARQVGIQVLILYASLADSVAPSQRKHGIHYTSDLGEVGRLLSEADKISIELAAMTRDTQSISAELLTAVKAAPEEGLHQGRNLIRVLPLRLAPDPIQQRLMGDDRSPGPQRLDRTGWRPDSLIVEVDFDNTMGNGVCFHLVSGNRIDA